MTSTETGRRRLSRFLIGLAGVILLLVWIGICAYQSYVAAWVGASSLQCANVHLMGTTGAFWRVVISGVAIPAVAGLLVFSRASLVKDADGWYWARAVLFFAVGGILASILSRLILAAWDYNEPGAVVTNLWQPFVRFIISGTGTAPWVIGIIACIIIGVRTSRPMKRTVAAVIAAAVVLGLEVLAMTGYLALLSYYCA